MRAPTSDLVIYAGVLVKTWHVPHTGTVVENHVHTWDHVTLIMSGSVRVFIGGTETGVFAAPALVKIAANKQHYMTTLTDDVRLACIHAVGETEKE